MCVLGHILPAHSVYHIVDCPAIIDSIPRTLVHRVWRKDGIRSGGTKPEDGALSEQRGSSTRVETAILRSCRRLCRLGYSFLYGENHFVFDYAPKYANISIAVSQADQNLLGSRPRAWSRPLDASWPLNAQSSRFVRSLTVLAQLAQQPSDEDNGHTASQLNQLFRLFGDGHNLKRCVVDLDTCQHLLLGDSVSVHRYGETHREEFDEQRAQGRAGYRLMFVSSNGSGSFLQLRNPIHADSAINSSLIWEMMKHTCDAPQRMRELWEPVRRLRDVEEVVLSGSITEALAEELAVQIRATTGAG